MSQGPQEILNSSFDTDVSGWTGTNATLTRVTTPVRAGAGAMQIAATAAGNASATWSTILPVLPGQRMTLSAYFRSAATARSAMAQADWLTALSGGTLISTSSSTTITTTTAGYTQSTSTLTAPGTAFAVRIYATIVSAAASEIHYVDDVTLNRFFVVRRIGSYR